MLVQSTRSRAKKKALAWCPFGGQSCALRMHFPLLVQSTRSRAKKKALAWCPFGGQSCALRMHFPFKGFFFSPLSYMRKAHEKGRTPFLVTFVVLLFSLSLHKARDKSSMLLKSGILTEGKIKAHR